MAGPGTAFAKFGAMSCWGCDLPMGRECGADLNLACQSFPTSKGDTFGLQPCRARTIFKPMPSPDEPPSHYPEEKSKVENRLIENGWLIALCVVAAIAGYFMAQALSEWILGIH